MFWSEEVAARCRGPQIINDSKTPSGRVHVGALRGVLIHDAIFRTLQANGIEARYLFGVDDYDPLDEIPAGKGEHFEQVSRPAALQRAAAGRLFRAGHGRALHGANSGRCSRSSA